MFVDFCILIIGGLGQGAASLDQELSPPPHFLETGLGDAACPTEGIDCPLANLLVFAFDHLVDFSELLVDLLDDCLVLILEEFLILSHFDVDMFDFLQFLLQDPQVLLVVLGDTADGLIAGDYPMVFMCGTPVDTIHTEQLELVLAVQSDEVVVHQALLW